MCGIAGIIGFHPHAQDLARSMQQCMVHRGPDSEGCFHNAWASLAVRRLRIVDHERGDQPIKNEDGSVIAVLNGEIYNDTDLRHTLQSCGHTFFSRCDTEVLVHGYEQWGIDGLLQRLDGMFSFALLDIHKRRAFIARDVFGEKPLYYIAGQKYFAFASEMQAMLSARVIPMQIDAASLHDYFRLHYVPGPSTILQSVHKLQPGHVITIDGNTGVWHSRCFAKIHPVKTQDSLPDAATTVRALVTKSVMDRLRADVPVGTVLSGGLDSSIITAIAAKEIPGIPVFNMGFSEEAFDESSAARTLAQHVGAVLHPHTLTPEEGLRTLPKVIASMDEPCGDQALLPLYLLAHDAKTTVRVLLTGDGADEIFGGYAYYAHAGQTQNFLQNLWREKEVTDSGFPLVSSVAQRQFLLSAPKKYHRFRMPNFRRNDALLMAQEEDIRTWLPDDLLMKTDKMTMASSIEARCPFLSVPLAEYALGLPSHYKRTGTVSKVVLREAFCDLLPPEIYRRPKQAFAVPIGTWLRGHWRSFAEDVFRLQQDDGCRPNACIALLQEHMKGADCARLLYAILAYRLWFHEHSHSGNKAPVAVSPSTCSRVLAR